MVERGANLRADRPPSADLGDRLGPLLGLGGTLLLLAVLASTVGIGGAGWLVGLGSGLAVNVALARALGRDPSATLGPATWVTLARATLVVGVAALTAASFERSLAVGTLVTLASVALALDWVDGRVARRTATESALGARLDGEVDAFLILVLSIEVAPTAGAWVLAIGLARYAFLAAGWKLAWMRATLPRRDWRKTVTAAQGVALTLAAAQVLRPAVTDAPLGVALALLAESFGRDVRWLWRERRNARVQAAAIRARSPAVSAALTLLALVVVWAALVAPARPRLLTPSEFVRLPLEGIVLVALALALPAFARRSMAWLVGLAIGALVLVKLLDVGFFIAFDRPFNPVDDWSFARPAVGLVRDTYGRRDADLAVAGAALLAFTLLFVPVLAMNRLTSVAARQRRRALGLTAALGGVWVLFWGLGAQVSGAAIASASATRYAADEIRAVQTFLRNQARFQALLGHKDPYATIPADRLLTGLRGKDVLLVFVESYGKIAVQGTPFSPAVDTVLADGEQQLSAAGFSARSGWLTSPTWGGGSPFSMATLQSGLWVNNPGRFSALIAHHRATLASSFERAGWRTVADMPATHGKWRQGHSFYRYDAVYDRTNLGYRGPGFGFSPLPDQYALEALQKSELAKANRRPVFANVFLSSSHEPWTRIPPLIDWSELGNGSIFNRLPIDRTGESGRPQGFAAAIQYSLRTLFSFIEQYGNSNTVVIMLGDEQPQRVFTTPGSFAHQVPISLIARDPGVLARISGWGWEDGLLPDSSAPTWPMSAFRNRFLAAFGPPATR